MEPLTQLADIFNDEEVPLRRRIEAAALVLQHEAPDELVADAADFLMSVAKMDVAATYRIEAVKALAKREVPRAGTVAPVNRAEWTEGWRNLAIDERRKALQAAGEWEDRPADWADDLKSPDWIPPEGNPNPPVDVVGFGDRMRAYEKK